MPDSRVVDLIRSITTGGGIQPHGGPDSGDDAHVVECVGGTRAWLDPREPRTDGYLRTLENLQDASYPASLIVSDTDRLIGLDIPLMVKVRWVERLGNGDVDVRLQPSHTAHVLRATHPDFERLHDALTQARDAESTVAVTESRGHVILDVASLVRLAVDPLDLRTGAVEVAPPLDQEQWTVLADEQEVRRRFREMREESCDRKEQRCIPFTYPTDGCHARAHRICELLLQRHQVRAGKVWLFGNLVVETPNDPDCRVEWKYHVAPVVRARVNGGIELFVLDPSLFSDPVPIDRWKDKQGEDRERDELSEASLWDQPPWGNKIVDSDFSRTPRDLVPYQELLNQQIEDKGEPPYCD